MYLTRTTTGGLFAQHQRLFLCFPISWLFQCPQASGIARCSRSSHVFDSRQIASFSWRTVDNAQSLNPSKSVVCMLRLTASRNFAPTRPRRTFLSSSSRGLYLSLDYLATNIFSRYGCFTDIQLVQPLSLVKAPSSHLTDLYYGVFISGCLSSRYPRI